MVILLHNLNINNIEALQNHSLTTMVNVCLLTNHVYI